MAFRVLAVLFALAVDSATCKRKAVANSLQSSHAESESSAVTQQRRDASSLPFSEITPDEIGTWVWRIHGFKPVYDAQAVGGKFYDGDCYIVLDVKAGSSSSFWWTRSLYFWIGSHSTQDEQGAASLLATELEKRYDGRDLGKCSGKKQKTQYECVHDRADQFNESDDFVDIFSSAGIALVYLKGGENDGWDSAEEEQQVVHDPLLYMVRKTAAEGMRVIHVPAQASSLNQDDCFILDAWTSVRTWCGNTASPFEKMKAHLQAEKMDSNRGADVDHAVEKPGPPSDTFWDLLGDRGDIAAQAPPNLEGLI